MNRLGRYLKAKEITQHQFAERLGVSQGTVSKMCRKGAEVRDSMKVRIERLTGGAVPVEAWLDDLRDSLKTDGPVRDGSCETAPLGDCDRSGSSTGGPSQLAPDTKVA